MQAHTKILWVVLLALAIQLAQAAVVKGQSDCNNNSIPDECDVDCGVPGGACDILGCGQSNDCNNNGIPDECEIFVSRAFTVTNNTSNIYVSRAFTVVNNTSNIYVSRAFTVVNNTSNIFVSRAFTVVNTDCNGNGIPDQCDVDCGVPGGPCDIPGCGQSLDCNNNGCPDECETDCDGNGIPDDCDIAACPPGDPSCADCNGNGILDPCDIASGLDGDCNLNGVPDECDLAFGLSNDVTNNMTGLSGGDAIPDECINWSDGELNNTLWSSPANWEANNVPGDGVDQAMTVESPGINLPETIVDLDIEAIVDSLILGVNSTLNLSAGNLTIDSPNGIQNEGIFNINDGRSLIAASKMSLTGMKPINLTGPTAKISSAMLGDTLTSQVTILGQGVIDADFVNDTMQSVIATSGGILQIAGTMPKVNNGIFKATSNGTLQIDTPITGSGSYIADHGTVEINADIMGTPGSNVSFTLIGGIVLIRAAQLATTTVDGCGPIIILPGSPALFSVDGSSLINASSWTIGDTQTGMGMTAKMELLNNSIGLVNGPVTVKQNGTLRIIGSSLTATDLTLEPGANLEVGSSLALSGSFTNDKTDGTSLGVPCSWCWAMGSTLTFNGGQAASMNPASLTGWVGLEAASIDAGPTPPNNDFKLADIELADGAHVSLIDFADNGAAGMTQTVYCDSLTLGAGAVLNLNGMNLYVNNVAVMTGPSGGGTIEDMSRLLPGDLNNDGQFDEGDMPGFIAVLIGQDTDPTRTAAADLNTDGQTDGLDVQAFVNQIILP